MEVLHHVIFMVIVTLTAAQVHRQPRTNGCFTSEECCDNLACLAGRCSDPCNMLGCGPNTQCKTSSHTASCVPVIEPTTPTPVKPTAAPTDCTLECAGNDQCPPGRACVDHRCVDPCPGRCGGNSTCKVVNHVPSCECLPGHTGNPLESCSHQPDTECLKSWPPLTTKVKKFQTYTMKKVDWLEALLQCRKKGRRLATVMNHQELNDIKATINKTNIRQESFWIAGTDHLHNQEWSWFTTDGMKLIEEFHDWMHGQPDSDKEDCLEFWERNREEGYKWNNRACHEQHHFVCEYYE